MHKNVRKQTLYSRHLYLILSKGLPIFGQVCESPTLEASRGHANRVSTSKYHIYKGVNASKSWSQRTAVHISDMASAFYCSQIHGPMHQNGDHKEQPHIFYQHRECIVICCQK